LRAADDEGVLSMSMPPVPLYRRIGFHSFMLPCRIATDDDITPVRQWSSDGLKSLASHNDGMTAGGPFEMCRSSGRCQGRALLMPMPDWLSVATIMVMDDMLMTFCSFFTPRPAL
jgi:hypothetical protein